MLETTTGAATAALAQTHSASASASATRQWAREGLPGRVIVDEPWIQSVYSSPMSQDPATTISGARHVQAPGRERTES